jgi:hypothetical protein
MFTSCFFCRVSSLLNKSFLRDNMQVYCTSPTQRFNHTKKSFHSYLKKVCSHSLFCMHKENHVLIAASIFVVNVPSIIYLESWYLISSFKKPNRFGGSTKKNLNRRPFRFFKSWVQLTKNQKNRIKIMCFHENMILRPCTLLQIPRIKPNTTSTTLSCDLLWK